MAFTAPDANGVITQTGRDLDLSGLAVNGGATITTDVGITTYDFGTNRLFVEGTIFHDPEKEVLVFRHTSTSTTDNGNVACIYINNPSTNWSNISGPWAVDADGRFVLTITGNSFQIGDAFAIRNAVIVNDTDDKNLHYTHQKTHRVMAVNGDEVTITTKPFGTPSISAGQAVLKACYNYGSETIVDGRTRYSAGTGLFFTGGSASNYHPNEAAISLQSTGFFFGRGGVISSSRPFHLAGNCEMVRTELFASRKVNGDNLDIRTLGIGVYQDVKLTSLNLTASWTPRQLSIALESGSLSEAVGSYTEGSFKDMDFSSNANVVDIGHDAGIQYQHRDYELINSATGSNVKQMWRDVRTSTSQKGVVVTKKEVSMTIKDADGQAISGAKVYLKDNPSAFAKDATFPVATNTGPYTTESTLLGGVLNPDGTMSYFYANPFEYDFTTDSNGAVDTLKIVTSSQIKEFSGGDSSALASNGGPYDIPSFNSTWRESDNLAPTFSDWDTDRFGGFYRVDRRSDSNTNADDFTFKFCSYEHALSQSTQALKGVGELAVNWVLFADASVTETDKAVVDGYLQLETPEKFYDRAKAFLVDNYAGETATIVSREGTTINAGAYNVTIDASAAEVFAFDGTTITIKSAQFVGNITGSGTFTLLNGAEVVGTFGATTVYLWEVSNVEAGSTLQLFNVTQDIEIENLVVSGTAGTKVTASGTYATSEAVPGDAIRLRLTCQAGTSALLPFETVGVATASGVSFRADQQIDTTYNANNIDGSSISGITLTPDYTNIQIDLDDQEAPYELSAQAIYNYYSYLITTPQGIANFYGAITPVDRMNYRINASVVPLKIQNTGSTDVVLNGGRLYRDDSVSVLDTGAGSGTGSIMQDTGFLVQYIQPQVGTALNNYGAATSTELSNTEATLKKKITQAALV